MSDLETPISNSGKMDEELIKAMTDYYRLKSKYESKNEKRKSVIKSNTNLTPLQKRKKIKQLIPACIVCKNAGGTIFSNNKGVLTAVCGSTNPCKLNIVINRGQFVNLQMLDKSMTEDLNKTKIEIIKTKLNLLFEYNNESDTIKAFNVLRPELKAIEELKLKWHTEYLNAISNAYNKEKLVAIENKLYEEKQALVNLGKEYTETERQNIIIDMVNKYAQVIKPLADEVRSFKYSNVAVEKQTDNAFIVHLVEQAYTLNDLEADTGDNTGVVSMIQ